MVQGHGDEPPDKLKVVQVIRIDIGRGIDLKAVVVLVGVLEETIHGVQHLVGQQEKPFPKN